MNRQREGRRVIGADERRLKKKNKRRKNKKN